MEIRHELGAVLIEREGVPEVLDAGVRGDEGQVAWYEADGADCVPGKQFRSDEHE
jgi:hypothetical protein